MMPLFQTDTLSFDSLKPIINGVIPILKKIGLALLFIIVGWIILKTVTRILYKLLKISKIDVLSNKLNDANIFGNPNVKINLGGIILKTARWLIILFLAIVASEQLGLKMISEQIGALLQYLPQLLSALAFLIIGLYIASLVKSAISNFLKSMEISGGNLIGNIVFMIIAIMVIITALNQAGINTDIITSNLTLIFGSMLLAFSIAFGLGSRDIVKRLLFGFYTRKNLEIGSIIKVNNTEGTIIAIDNISIKIKTNSKTIVLPINELVDSAVEIMN